MHLLTAADESPEDDFDAILHEDAGEHTAVLMFHYVFLKNNECAQSSTLALVR